MDEVKKSSFESAISHLLAASPKNSSKADKVKSWIHESFATQASVSRITEDKQLGNRITEQFAHKDPIVIFVLEPGVNRKSLFEKINQRLYVGLNTVMAIGNNGASGLTYEKLFIKTPSAFSAWCENDLGVKAELFTGSETPESTISKSFQLITYGAPGTGKSYGIEEVVKVYADTVRTTFHPDSDYATFVGCYKPTMKHEKKTYILEGKEAEVKGEDGNPVFEDRIVYDFVPQAFTKAYVRAWRKMVPGADGKIAPQFLVIEEINRGNCAQIFGDLFQLLDRDGAGYSKYAIEADSDLAKHIAKELADISSGIPSDISSGKILKLPPNLYIWATMNTSDQSLFPMDSAFKRRWEWEYIPIKDAGKDWKIVADGVEFKWWDFIKVINKYIFDTLKSEDKQLGYFFARPDDDVSDKIVASKFVNKVLFYLYNDVFKDYDLPKGFAKPDGKGKFTFGEFFLADGKPNEPAVKELLTGLLAQPQS